MLTPISLPLYSCRDRPVWAQPAPGEGLIHFTLGRPRPTLAVRIAGDMFIELDDTRRIAGLCLLNVPPFPNRDP